jgi:hypothetical protein
MGLSTLIGGLPLIGILSFFSYWVYIILHPLTGIMPGDLRPLLLGFYSIILLAGSLIETLLILLLTSLRWISRARGKMGMRLFGAIANRCCKQIARIVYNRKVSIPLIEPV